MFVCDYMKKSLLTVNKDTPIATALEILQKNQIRQLPVVEGEKLAGLVTEKQLLKVSPSPATSLGAFERQYFLANMKVSEVMVKFPLTVTPDTTIEEAALYMREHKIGSAPVVVGEKLVGIITVTDIFDALIKYFGYGKSGLRLVIESRDRSGLFAEITQLLNDFNAPVKGVIYFVKDNEEARIKLRIETSDASPLLAAMKSRGFKITCY